MSALTPLSARLALAFTPTEARGAVTALDTLAQEIRVSLAEGLDHTVAHTRLVWWREEVARLTEGAPLHPVSRTLHAAAPAARYQRLEALIIACEFVLAGHQPANEAERAALYGRMYGAVEALRCELIEGVAQPHVETFATRLAEVLGHAELAELSLFDERTAALAALRSALVALNASITGARGERHGLVVAGLLAHRLTPTGLTPEPAPLRALYLAWRTARRHRLEIA